MIRATYGRYMPGTVSYLPAAQLLSICRASKTPARIWKFNNSIRSAIIGRDRLVALENFPLPAPAPEERWGEIIEDCRLAGLKPPSSLPGIFHTLYEAPRPCSTVDWPFRKLVVGGWQAVRPEASCSMLLRQYDLVSAYAWAASAMPLPDPRTAWGTTRWVRDGIYIAEFTLPDGLYPYPLRPGRNIQPITPAELELYGASAARILQGFRFDRTVDIRPWIDGIRGRFRMWKRILRCFWGRWISSHGVECGILRDGNLTKSWTLPPYGQNALWGHLIVSRVKQRIFRDFKGKIFHVFVDSVITPAEIATGTEIGDWKLVETYRNGLVFAHPGAYKDPESGEWLKRSGVPVQPNLRAIG